MAAGGGPQRGPGGLEGWQEAGGGEAGVEGDEGPAATSYQWREEGAIDW